MVNIIEFREIPYKPSGYYALMGILVAAAIAGLVAAGYMADAGHHVTGMSNRIVWGMPHVFSVFLILSAAGALGVASMANVLGRTVYKPLSRLSAVLALALLVGGLSVLWLDLGQPGRVPTTLSSLNFSSIFAWNIFVYTGFALAVLASLWMMIERKMNRYSKPVGLIAFLLSVWLATDVGSVFGVLVARQAYDTAIMAPLFVVASLAFGLAVFILVLVPAFTWTGRPLGEFVVRRLGRTLGIVMAIMLYLVAMQHIVGNYAAERQGVEDFILSSGGVYTTAFWVLQVAAGSLVPIALIFYRGTDVWRGRVMLAAALVVLGGLAQLYVIIIGAQAYPLVLFPGMETASSFLDGRIATYTPSPTEIVLGVGGIGLALALVALAVKVLPVLPMSMADSDVDPHYRPAEVEEDPPAPADEPEKPDEDMEEVSEGDGDAEESGRT
jgi:molybdopterin-containing oxidoreductase family membrane subunit